MLSITKEDSKISHFIPPTDVIIQQILYFSINLVNLIETVPVGITLPSKVYILTKAYSELKYILRKIFFLHHS